MGFKATILWHWGANVRDMVAMAVLLLNDVDNDEITDVDGAFITVIGRG